MNQKNKWRLIISLSHAIRIAHRGQTKVKCPHCATETTFPVLPLVPIVIAVCDKCQEYVLPFAGTLLGLPKESVETKSPEVIKEVVTDAIMGHLRPFVEEIASGENFEGNWEFPNIDHLDIPDNLDDLEKLWEEEQ